MSHLPDELRLLILIAVNVFVFVEAFRFVRRFTSQDWIGATLDALLIHYLVQYFAVCVPGLLGIFRAETMLLVAIALGAGMTWFHRRAGFSPHVLPTENSCGLKPARRLDSLIIVGCLLFVLGYFASLIYTQSTVPLVGDDALTYHLPSVGQWLQTGRLGIYTTWFFNPANTYSPLAGSTFFAWLIAPIGADVVAQFAQMPALILMFFAIVQIAHTLGVSISIASIAATAALLSRPFISEAILVKDDHFLAAFFLAAVSGCAADRLKDRLGPWRIGCALGLFFATKYTALLTAPLLLLLIDAPFRAQWKVRHWITAIACVFALAAPWYLRNWAMTGNPLYPVPLGVGAIEIFHGMFVPERSTEMRTLSGAWHALTGGYNSPSNPLVITLMLAWGGAVIMWWRNVCAGPLARLAMIGPALGLVIFFLGSHAALIRYAYPSLLLLFLCASLFVGRLPIPLPVQPGITIAIAALSTWGGFEHKGVLSRFIVAGSITCVIGIILLRLLPPLMKDRRVRVATFAGGGLVLVCVLYIYWHAFLDNLRTEGYSGTSRAYPDKVPMWNYIAEHVPPNAPIAYTNLVFTRPLMGFDYSRRTFYLPTRPVVRNYHDLPHSRQRVTDQDIRAFVAKLLTDLPDEKMWRENLLTTDAQYLLVGRQPVMDNPPERAFAEHDPAHFQPEFSNESGTLYRIIR